MVTDKTPRSLNGHESSTFLLISYEKKVFVDFGRKTWFRKRRVITGLNEFRVTWRLRRGFFKLPSS